MSINNKLLTFLEKQLGPSKRYTGEEYYFKCPLCQRADNAKKLAIKLDPNAKDKNANSIYLHWHCWRDTSHKGANIFQLLKKMKVSTETYNELKNVLGKGTALQNFDDRIQSLQNDGKKIYVKPKGLPEEFLSLLETRDNPHYKNAYRYVKSRGLTKEDIFKYNIGYCETGKYGGYIIIPSYDEEMNINYFVARSFYNSPLKHKNPPFKKDTVFNEIFINWKEPIILCEGAFDMLAIKRNAIPILGKYIQNTLKLKILKNGVKDIYIALDRDAIKDSIKIVEEFMKNDINVYFVGLTDKDPSKLGFKSVWQLIKSASRMDFQQLIKLKLEIK